MSSLRSIELEAHPKCQPTNLAASSVVRIGSIQTTISSMSAGFPRPSMPTARHVLKTSASSVCRRSWFRRDCLKCSPLLWVDNSSVLFTLPQKESDHRSGIAVTDALERLTKVGRCRWPNLILGPCSRPGFTEPAALDTAQ